MRTSVMPKGCRRFTGGYLRRPIVVVLCLVCLACCQLSQWHFVPGIRWAGQATAAKQVTQRSAKEGQEASSADSNKKRLVMLTNKVKASPSARELIDTLEEAMDHALDFVFVSAAYNKLAKLKQRRYYLQQRDWESDVLGRLHSTVENMALEDQLNAWATASVLWSLAKLSDQFSIPAQFLNALVQSMPTKARGMNDHDLANCLLASVQLQDDPVALQMVPSIVDQIPTKAKDMGPQSLANSLWSLAKLKDVVPAAVDKVPDIAAQIPGRAKDMNPQHLSNCLWACLLLKDDAPALLKILPAIMAQIPAQIKYMKPQDLSNSMEALALLQDSSEEVALLLAESVGSMDDIFTSVAKRLKTVLPGLRGMDLSFAVPVVVWALGKGDVYDEELLVSVSKHLGSRKSMSKIPNFGLCALLWSYEELDAPDKFQEFRELLASQVARKGLSDADVQSCRLGRSEWNRA